MILDNVLIGTTNEQINKIKGHRTGVGLNINISLGFIIGVVVFYYNYLYIRKCFPKDQRIIQYILAIIFGIFYTLFRMLVWGYC